MRIAIYGAGAMGTALGAFLTRSGQRVDLISRNASHIQRLKEHGAKIVGTVNFTVDVSALLPEEMQGRYDIIFLMTKQRENAKTVKFLLPYLALDGVICTTQNGLPEPLIAEYVGRDRCLGCAVSWGASLVEDGVVRLTSSPKKLTFSIGSVYGGHPYIYNVKRILQGMGRVSVESNFLGARWAKLCINSAFSSLSALTGLTFGEVAKMRQTRRAAQAVLKECFEVAAKNQIKIQKIQGADIVALYGYKGNVKKAVAYALIPLAMKKHKEGKSGMLFDLLKGKICDIDFVNGVVIDYGKRANCPTPVNGQVVALIHKIESGELTVSPSNVNLIEIPH